MSLNRVITDEHVFELSDEQYDSVVKILKAGATSVLKNSDDENSVKCEVVTEQTEYEQKINSVIVAGKGHMCCTLPAYIGTKVVGGEPMTQHEFCKEYLKEGTYSLHKTVFSGYHVQYKNPDGGIYNSWSPKDVFEDAYTPIDLGIDFGFAFYMMRKGNYVRHDGWHKELAITIKNGRIVDNEGNLFGLDTEDIERCDWMVIE